MSIELAVPSNHLVLCCALFHLPSIFPASGSFPAICLYIGWPKHWSFSFSISPFNEYSGLISFRTDWFDLLAFPVPQLISINASSLNLLYGPTLKSVHDYWKKPSLLTIWTFVSKVMSLFFSDLSRFVITSLSRSKCLVISWL